MDRIVFLGTSRCLPTLHRDNTSLLYECQEEALLIDCGGKPYQKLLQANLDPDKLATIIITHYHVDHCYGLPSLLSSLHLSGRTRPLCVLGLPGVIDKLAVLMGVFDYPETWDKVMPLFPIEFVKVPPTRGAVIHTGPALQVSACVNSHIMPNLATRTRFEAAGKTVVYTSDTAAPNPDIVQLARGADILIHETNFLSDDMDKAKRDGHTAAPQVREMILSTGIRRVFLVHHGLDTPADAASMTAEIGAGDWEVFVPNDMDSWPL